MKRQTLLELVDYVNTGTGKFTELVSEVLTPTIPYSTCQLQACHASDITCTRASRPSAV